jgi:hypothetical protein
MAPAAGAHGRNPVLPAQLHIPDPEARVMPDGRVYVYGSWDRRDDFFCSGQYRVVSSVDLLEWTDHGESFDVTHAAWVGDPAAPKYPGFDWTQPTPFIRRLIESAPADFKIPQVPKDLLFAPDAIHRDGRYWLYFCASDQSEGVAVADSPRGPFRDARQLPCGGIDPAVFIDDDGQAYFYWGQFHAHGAKLKRNMVEFEDASIVHELLSEQAHHFHEGSSLRKRDGLYYFVYTSIERGKPTSLAYATATSPLGPFTHRGVIVDNAACDPKSWNNHGSIECVNGRWYVFYHRASRCTQQWRRLCIEPIEFDDEGLIREVPMTSQGAGRPFGLGERIEGWRACELRGTCFIGPSDDGVERLRGIGDDDEAVWRHVEWDAAPVRVEFEARGSGEIEFFIDDDAAPFAQLSIADGRAWPAPIVAARPGRHTLRARFRRVAGLEFGSLRFYG